MEIAVRQLAINGFTEHRADHFLRLVDDEHGLGPIPPP
jgi:hypothetical protein